MSPLHVHGRLGRLGALVYRRRGRTVLAWVAALVAAIVLSPLIAGSFGADFATKGSESERAAAVLKERFPGRSGDTVTVAWKAPQGAASPAVRARVDRFLRRAERLKGIGDGAAPRVSRDGTIASTTLELDRRAWDVPDATGRKLIDLAKTSSGDGLTIALGGGIVRMAEGGSGPEGISLLAAAAVLLIAFGSIVAAGLPLAVALFGLGISASLITVLAAVVEVPDFAPAVAGLLGIGVGIDYALLVLTRFRAALGAGADVEHAIVEAVGTAGRSVLVAGTTVLISVLGLFLMGVGYLQGVALSASLAVLVVMAAAVTLLPALLSFAGPRVNRLRLPALPRRPLGVRPRLVGRRQRHPAGRALNHDRPTPAARWSHVVQRRPWTAAVAGAAVALAIAAPVLGLRLGFPDEGNDKSGTMTRTAYDLTTEGFGPGANGPLLLAAELPRGQGTHALDGLVHAARQDPDVAFVAPPRSSPDGRAAVVTVVPKSSPQDASTPKLVKRLRDTTIPATTRATVYVGGATATFVDQSDLVARRLPLFIAGVLGLSFLLLLSAFRSPLIAAKAGLMNLLSVGAAYGVIALFAGGNWFGAHALGIDTSTPVAPFIPVMMFAILFGLSMDYEVFLLSRVREEYLRHGDNSRAVADGLAKTARVITAAAAIMVVVFLAFVFSGEIFLKLLGLGMATAIFVDATIVRMVLVPALMQLLGRANWWMPRWLDRAVPRLAPEST
jgi:RND superfamily putative drug exporter